MRVCIGTATKCGLRLTSACSPRLMKIVELIDRVHSFEELADLFKRRHAEELGGL